MVFSISREAMKVKDLPNPLTGSQVDLEAVLTWMIRNLRLHKADSEELEANIKLDGRPFWGLFMLYIYSDRQIYAWFSLWISIITLTNEFLDISEMEVWLLNLFIVCLFRPIILLIVL